MVLTKIQKAGTDFTPRPYLDLPWEWGGGTHQQLSSLPSIFENAHEAENYTTARVHLDLLEYGGAGY